jgi:NADH dehydrogenase FAD-containing subunit
MTGILLIGGGHAHLIAAPLIAQARVDDARIALVAPSAQLLYSGMMPGWLSGQYDFDECAIDLARVCRAHGIDWIEDEIVDIDFALREALGRKARYPFDLASVNVGSENDPGSIGESPPAVLCAKPFAGFVDDWTVWLEAARSTPRPRALLVVGGGAAAVEIAFSLAALAADGSPLAGSRVVLATAGDALLPGMSRIAAHLAHRSLAARGIEARFGCRYLGAADGCARFEGASPIAADLVIVATGARPPRWLAAAARRGAVALADDGGLAIHSDLRSTSHAAIFSAGDCASFVDQRVPKSGVHALRQGPVLATNLIAALTQSDTSGPSEPGSTDPVRFAARRRTLALLNRCDGSAIGAWGPIGFAGRWAWRWKDRIDRRFMARFS